MAKLEGKAALVTGSSRGIGRAIALRLAQEGADVVVHFSSSEADARKVAEEIQALGRRVGVVQGDLLRVQAARDVVKGAIGQLGKLDILVNNAGREKRQPFWEVTEDDYERTLGVNLRGPFFCTQELVRHKRSTRTPGRIINISSVHEELAFPGFTPYAASKGALRMLTRTLAVELRGTGITVNSIAPGAIQTEMNAELLEEPERKKALLAQIPLGRLGRPEDVAGLAAFLAGPDADYVTGSTYFVDGGLSTFYEE